MLEYRRLAISPARREWKLKGESKTLINLFEREIIIPHDFYLAREAHSLPFERKNPIAFGNGCSRNNYALWLSLFVAKKIEEKRMEALHPVGVFEPPFKNPDFKVSKGCAAWR